MNLLALKTAILVISGFLLTNTESIPRADDHFATTRWSVVLKYAHAISGDQTGQDALEQLCRAYWRPVFAFVVRRGYPAADAQDITQDFFVHILNRGLFKLADPERGRFRNLLLKSLQNFMLDDFAKSLTQKRGGKVEFISWEGWTQDGLERLSPDSTGMDWSAEKCFDSQWAASVAVEARRRLREECEGRGYRRMFDALALYLTEEGMTVSYANSAAVLGISESNVKNMVHRLRRRYGILLREEIAQTLLRPEDLADEVRYLFSVLAAGGGTKDVDE